MPPDCAGRGLGKVAPLTSVANELAPKSLDHAGFCFGHTHADYGHSRLRCTSGQRQAHPFRLHRAVREEDGDEIHGPHERRGRWPLTSGSARSRRRRIQTGNLPRRCGSVWIQKHLEVCAPQSVGHGNNAESDAIVGACFDPADDEARLLESLLHAAKSPAAGPRTISFRNGARRGPLTLRAVNSLTSPARRYSRGVAAAPTA